MKRYKKEFGFSYALGMTVTFELLLCRPKSAQKVYLHPSITKNDNYFKLSKTCETLGIQTIESEKAFNILSPKENCFVIGEFEKYASKLDGGAPHTVLVSPMNAGNVGTILRTALGLGYENVALVEPCADIFSPEVVRASMGALFRLNVEVFKSIDEYRANFAHNLYPFMLSASLPIEQVEFVSPYALVFGNEAHGLPEEFASLGQSVIIPCTDKVDSLNLSIAAAIGMYEAKKRTK